MSRQIVTKNHADLVQVLEAVRKGTFDKNVLNMADRMLERIRGCTSHKLVGISADRGLPFVGYANDPAYLYDTDRRKVAPAGRFYKLYVDGSVTQEQRDRFEQQLVLAGQRLGFFTPNSTYDKRIGVVPQGTLRARNACDHVRVQDNGDW